MTKKIKPKKTARRWKPDYGVDYYFFEMDGNISQEIYRGDDMPIYPEWITGLDKWKFGNCFKTKTVAIRVRNKIKKFLRGL